MYTDYIPETKINFTYLLQISQFIRRGPLTLVSKIFNSLPSNIQIVGNDTMHFKDKLHIYLIINSFYSIIDFSEHNTK